MHLYSVAVLIAAVLLSCVEPATPFDLSTVDYLTEIRFLADNQNSVNSKRLLRRYDKDDEERAIGGGTISKLATKLKDGASTLAKKVVNTNKYEAEVATTLKFGNIDNVLTSSNLEKLATEVKKTNSKNFITKISVIGTLTTHYGDDVLAKALVTAENNADTRAVQDQIKMLREDQMMGWLNARNTADDVFKLLKIHDDGFSMVISRKLQVLEDYINFVKAKEPRFGGEEKMWALLQTARLNGPTKHQADVMETSLLKKWADEGQLPENVFQWLRLPNKVDDAFKSNNLNKFATYVDDFNSLDKEPNSKKSVIEIYTNSFGDARVAGRLMSAMDSERTRKVAKKLQAEQVEHWAKSTKSAEDVVKILKIQSDEAAAITRRKLAALQEFSKLKGEEQNLIKILTESLGSKGTLATTLESATVPSHTTTLQKKQFASLIEDSVTPANFMTSVFNTGVESATVVQKRIADKFTSFFKNTRRSD
ncbi:hypothetical protein AM587_10010406 [Phytophthora nicotianae]|uniref:Secreted RxLR effector peptide protein n=2 Tax=Phytophthora nicotianae TaxID=4792 RepID=A0A0W8C262_PHYNI|nr:hypothetical protein AM587_10010406 [Phytophthora nicotianae]